MTRRRRGRAVGITLGAVAIVGIGAATAAALGFGYSPSNAAAEAPSARPAATATITRAALIDSETASGVLGYGTVIDVNARIPGTLTEISAAGTAVSEGQPLFYVDNAPVMLLYGTVPAYRALSVGRTGPDVLQFEQDLWALGYRGFTVDNNYTGLTARAVRAWQKSLGETQTGTIDLGQVFYAAGQVRIASVGAAIGDEVGQGKAVLDVTGFTRSVTVNLDLFERRFAATGTLVNIVLPDGSSVPASVASSTTVVVDGTGENAGTKTTKLAVTVVPKNQNSLAKFDASTVDVHFTTPESGKPLTVPVEALLALAEGGYGVQIVDGKHTRIVPVTVGTFAGGRVEVSGSSIAAGDTVGVAE